MKGVAAVEELEFTAIWSLLLEVVPDRDQADDKEEKSADAHPPVKRKHRACFCYKCIIDR